MLYNYCDANTPTVAETTWGRDIPTVEVEMPKQSSNLRASCAHCEKPFYARPSDIRKRGLRHCSRACRTASKTPAAQLLKYADRSGGPDACWPWTFTRDKDGYGLLWTRKIRLRAHRAAWEQANEKTVPEGLVVRHRCPGGGNSWCCNPAHLAIGTVLENVTDTVQDGRKKRGEDVARTILTTEQVVSIRLRRATGESRAALACEFGVTRSAIAHIVQRRSWKHLPDQDSAGVVAARTGAGS